MNIAVVGATGMVGQEMLKVLEERRFPIENLIPVASDKSVGKTIYFADKEIEIVSVQDALNRNIDIALFSAGGEFSKTYAPLFAKNNCTVIDNSSAWRMEANIKLIVPEINGDLLKNSDKIIANPNCSTIQLVMTLWPLHKRYKLKRVVVSTYQSITGTGKKALDQMQNERNGKDTDPVYPYKIDQNCLPHCDVFLENDYTKEEMKLVHESRKIMNLPDLRLTATPNLFSKTTTISKALSDEINQYEAVTAILRFKYQDKLVGNSLSKKIISIFNNKNNYDDIMISGRDDKNIGMLFNSNEFSRKIEINAIVDEDEMFDPEDVFIKLIKRIEDEKH